MMVILTSSSPSSVYLSASTVRIQLIFLCYFISNTIAILEQVQASSAPSGLSEPSRKGRIRFPKSERSEYYFYSYGKRPDAYNNHIVGPLEVSHSHSFPIAYYGKFYGHS